MWSIFASFLLCVELLLFFWLIIMTLTQKKRQQKNNISAFFIFFPCIIKNHKIYDCNKRVLRMMGKFSLYYDFSYFPFFCCCLLFFLLFRKKLLRHFLYAIVTFEDGKKWKAYFNKTIKIAVTKDTQKVYFFNNFIVNSPRERSLSHFFFLFFWGGAPPKYKRIMQEST